MNIRIPPWQSIGTGIDGHLDKLEQQLASILAAQNEQERALAAARADERRLIDELRQLERDNATARAEGRRARSAAKVEDALTRARETAAALPDRIAAHAEAARLKRDELARYVEENAPELIEQHRPNAERAQAAVEAAMEHLRDAVSTYQHVAGQTDRLVTSQPRYIVEQHRRLDGHVPSLPTPIATVVSTPLEIPLPMPYERRSAGMDVEPFNDTPPVDLAAMEEATGHYPRYRMPVYNASGQRVA
jgi:hypothetical protein